MESPSAWASLDEGGKNGSHASRAATTTEDMFSVGDKSRPVSPRGNAYRTHKGRRRRQGRVEVPGLRGWQSTGIFNHTGPARTP